MEKKINIKNKKSLFIVISAILIIIVILSIIVVINNISINTDMQEENNIEEVNNGNQSKYSKEQIISLLTSEKDENGMIGIIAFAELRLRNELNSLDESTAYLFRYDYKVINKVAAILLFPSANT